MNRKTKTRMLVLSVVFLALGATVTFASSNNDVLKVHTILNNAIQDIQKIYFSSGAVKDVSHPEYEIPVLVQNGSVSMGGRMLMTTSGANNVLAKGSTGSSLFQGRNNVLSGVDSYIVAGSGNRIYQDVTGGVIIGGTENTIYQGENSYILGGNSNIIWSGNNSFIIGGKNGQITGNNSYIFMGNGSNQNKSAKINANNVVTFGKNVNIDKDNVFLWRDHSTTDEKSAKRENTFIMFAKNGLNILKNSTLSASFIATGAVKVEGSLQLSGEEVKCGKSIGGAVQYTGGMNGCFCGCNGTGWVSLVPSDKCRDLCPKITGRSYEDGKCIEVPADGLESLENNDSACDEGEISGYNQVDVGGFPASWTWECIGDNGSAVSCSATALSVSGKCFEGEGIVGEGDRYNCFKGKVTNEKDQNNKYTWDCEPINKPKEGNTEKCAVCHNGYTYMEGTETCERTTETKCINEGDDKFLCTNGGTASGSTLLKVSGVVIGGKWNCVSPTGGTGENGCHRCDSGQNYVWSGGANSCVLKKDGQCRTNFAGFTTTNPADSNWCNIGRRIGYSRNGNTYTWKCAGENGGAESNLCHYCAAGTWDPTSNTCVSNVWTVTFNANGGTWITTGSVLVPKNTVLNLVNYTGSKSGYDFLGWNTDSGATTAMSNPTVVSDMTLYAIFKVKTTPPCTEYAWSSYGGQKCTSNSKGNPCSGVDISHLGYSHSANKCTNFHELCCYNEGGPTEQELICACAIDATAPTTNTLHFISYGYFDNTLQGNGTMSDQVIECGKSFKINKNQFTKDGYVLLNWNAVDRDEDNFLMDLNDEHYVSGDMLEDFEDFIDNRCGITIDLYAEWSKKGCGTANEKSYNGKPANNLLCSAGITPTNQSENGALYTWKCEDNYCGACTNGFSYNNHCAGVTHNSTAKTITITDGSTSITIQDRNLGATAAGTGVYLGGSCPATFGKYYRWGNNIGFSCKASRYSTEVQDYLDYRNNYNLLYWETNGVKRVEPCPSGYHVPSKEEWDNLQRLWYNMAEFKMHNSSSSEYLAKHMFMDDFLLPSVYEKTVDGQGDISNITFGETKAYYMTSSFYKHPIYNTYMPILAFMDREHTYNDNFIRLDTEGCSNSGDCGSLFAVRCFKD